MVRWSKEPRRISVVEGRVAASLARDLRTVSCFIYNNETTKSRFCQAPCGHGRVNFSILPMQLSEGWRGKEAVIANGTFLNRFCLSALRAPLFAAPISGAIWTTVATTALGASEGNQVLAAPTWRSGQPEQHPLARVEFLAASAAASSKPAAN